MTILRFDVHTIPYQTFNFLRNRAVVRMKRPARKAAMAALGRRGSKPVAEVDRVLWQFQLTSFNNNSNDCRNNNNNENSECQPSTDPDFLTTTTTSASDCASPTCQTCRQNRTVNFLSQDLMEKVKVMKKLRNFYLLHSKSSQKS